MTPDISKLMASADWWESVEYWAAAIAVVAIALESWELFHLIRHGKLGEKLIEAIAVFVVVLALVVELLATAKSNNKTGLVIGMLNAEAENTRAISAKAIKAAADLGVTVDNLTQVAQTKAGEANIAIAALNEATAKAAGKVATIEKIVTPRTLNREQQMRIWAKVSAENIPISAAVFSTSGTFESAHLADQIASSLTADLTGEGINRFAVTYGNALSVSGVGILTSSSPRGQKLAEAVVHALNDEGVAAFVIPQKRMGCEEIDSVKSRAETDRACWAISVEVGDHP